MDLFIHTLTGTVFELRVSPFETVLSIKSKLQRLEGIAISQQHLIWRSMELQDEYCLHDYGIKSGATLTLVLAMRGGPINMRRVSLEEPTLQEMAEYMDENRDELWEKLMSDNKQVTLLVYREGDQLNFFRVYDGGDESISPYNDSVSTPSAYNGHDEDTTLTKKNWLEKQEEHLLTKDKMKLVRQQIESKKLPNIAPPPRLPSVVVPSSTLSRRRMQFTKQLPIDSNNPAKMKPLKPPVNLQLCEEQRVAASITRIPLPPVSRKGRVATDSELSELISPLDERLSTSPHSSDHNDSSHRVFKTNSSLLMKGPESSLQSHLLDDNNNLTSHLVTQNNNFNAKSPLLRHRELTTLHSANTSSKLSNIEKKDTCQSTSRVKHRSLKPLGSVDKSTASSNLFHQRISPLAQPAPALVRQQTEHDDETLDGTLTNNQLSDILRDPVEYENYKNLLKWVHPKTSNEHIEKVSMNRDREYHHGLNYSSSKVRRKTPDGRTTSSRLRSSKVHSQGNLSHLPPVLNDSRNIPTLAGKKKPRCLTCTKKLGLATTYQCRCGSKFCAKHRYPEAHTCTYDYKSEGRKLLQRSNPVVTAPKLPKI